MLTLILDIGMYIHTYVDIFDNSTTIINNINSFIVGNFPVALTIFVNLGEGITYYTLSKLVSMGDRH